MEIPTSLEKSLKLKKNGFPQDSKLEYVEWSLSSKGKRHWDLSDDIPSLAVIHNSVSAPCACKILSHLPAFIPDLDPSPYLSIKKFELEWHVEYPTIHIVIHNHLADACALMWIWLRKNYIIWD